MARRRGLAGRLSLAVATLAALTAPLRPAEAHGPHTLAQLPLVHVITDPLVRALIALGHIGLFAQRLGRAGAPGGARCAEPADAPYPQAVCNDGSRPGYFYRQASAQVSQFDWLVYLQGGDWCYSQETCDAVRWRGHAAALGRCTACLRFPAPDVRCGPRRRRSAPTAPSSI